jgi:hypothetical protein
MWESVGGSVLFSADFVFSVMTRTQGAQGGSKTSPPHPPKRTHAEPPKQPGKAHGEHHPAGSCMASLIFRVLTKEGHDSNPC